MIDRLSNGRTYGECLQVQDESMELINGVFARTINIFPLPKRLNNKIDSIGGSEAGRYYNKKLYKYWFRNYYPHLRPDVRSKVISLLTGVPVIK